MASFSRISGADGSITTSKLANGAVTNPKLASGSVNTINIIDNAVTSAKILAGNVGTSQLASGSVTSAKIAVDAVGTSHLASGSVTNLKLSSGSVNTANIIDNAVTSAKIASVNWSAVTGRPATLSGYGITDAVPSGTTYGFDSITSKPTTLSGYGITDAIASSDVVTVASANKILRLDASGNLPASISGNATTATKLTTTRSITLTGDATSSGVNFDGTANISITTTLADSGVGTTGGVFTKVTVDRKGRVTTGATLVATDIPSLDWAKIATGKPTTLAGYGITDAVPSGTTYSFASLTSKPTTIAGYGITDAALTTHTHSLTVNGDASGTVSLDNTAKTLTLTMANSGVTAGTYPKVTVDAKGRVTGGASLVAADIPAHDWSKITTGKPTTISGYGITDAVATTGNAATATKLQTGRTIALTGAVTGTSTSFDGTANLSFATTLANFDWSKITTGKPTTLSGYGITDAVATGSVGIANGIAQLGADGKVPASQLPSGGPVSTDWANITGTPTTLSGYGITGGTISGLTVSGNIISSQATATNHVIVAGRTISAGAGLTGGGDLTANRSLAVDFSGNGSSTKVSRADHNHDANYLELDGTNSMTGKLNGVNMSLSGVRDMNNRYFEKYVGTFNFVSGNANQKIDISWSGNFYGYFDVELTGGWNITNFVGRLVKRFAFVSSATNPTPTYQQTRYVEAIGGTGANLAISDVTWDATTSRWTIQIACLSSSNSPVFVRVIGSALGSSDMTNITAISLGSIYTTDTTVFPTPSIQLLGGTTALGNLILNNQATATTHAVRADRLISAGAGLTGGGNLTVDRTLAVDFSGNGSSVKVSRADHNHDANYLSLTGGTVTRLTATNEVIAGTRYVNYNLGNQATDYVQTVILLHQIFSGGTAYVADNYCQGTLFASRGGIASLNRKAIAKINTSSAYNGVSGSIESDNEQFTLVTCLYGGVKYMAVKLPYSGSFFSNGVSFDGASKSSGPQSLLLVNYYNQNTATVLNSEVYDSIANFATNTSKWIDINQFNVSGSISANNFIGELNGVRYAVSNVTPSSPVPIADDIWFDTTAKAVKRYTGSTWEMLGGAVSGGASSTELVGVLPSATEQNRGRNVLLTGSATSPDSLYVCMKLANNNYDWVQVK